MVGLCVAESIYTHISVECSWMLSGTRHEIHVAHGAHRCRAGSFGAANELLHLLIPDLLNFPDGSSEEEHGEWARLDLMRACKG